MEDVGQCYLPIASTREICILYLRLGKSNDKLVGRLEHVALDVNPSYEALSYEWVRPKKEKEILL
jgi:hypothetical protein